MTQEVGFMRIWSVAGLTSDWLDLSEHQHPNCYLGPSQMTGVVVHTWANSSKNWFYQRRLKYLYCIKFSLVCQMPKTRNRLRVAFESGKGGKAKMVKWCWKKWNEPILMHIYNKQCEIMQKNRLKSSNGQIHCFCKGNQLRGAKNLEN